MNEKPLIETGRGTILSLAEETRFAPNGIVSRTLFRAGRQRMILFGFAEGQELSEHTSTSHALVQILSGSCEWVLDGQPRTLQAGDFLYMPPDLRHAVRATEAFSMLLTLLPPEAPAPTLPADATVKLEAGKLPSAGKLFEPVSRLAGEKQVKVQTN
jgi:quercetin dioxygenase-like cupin family protein